MDDEEIKKTFHLSIDEPNIIRLTMQGSVNTVPDNVRQAQMITQYFNEIYSGHTDKQFDCLIDLGAIGGVAHYPSPQARQIYAEIIDNQKLNKVAIVATSALSRAIMRFILYATNKKRGASKFFKNVDEATSWLAGKAETYQP